MVIKSGFLRRRMPAKEWPVATVFLAALSRWQVLAPVVVIAGFTSLFYEGVLFRGEHIPYDATDNFYPFFYFAWHSWKIGDLGFWNPYIFAGYPFTWSGLFTYSPVYWTFSLIPGDFSLNRFAQVEVAHLFLGAVGTYLFARGSRVSTAAALAAALVYSFGGSMASRTQHVATIETASFFPWGLLVLRSALRRQSWRLAFFGGLLFGWSTEAASAGLLTGYASLAILLAEAMEITERRLINVIRHYWLIAIIALAGCVSIAFPRLLPEIDFGMRSVFDKVSLADALSHGVSPLAYVSLFIPSFYGTTRGSQWWGPGDLTESYYYFGISTIVFIAASLQTRERRRVLLWWFVGAVALLYSLGGLTILYPLAFYMVPGVNRFHRPSDVFPVLNLAVAMLAAEGLRVLEACSGNGRANARLFRIGTTLLTVCALALVVVLLMLPWAQGPTIGRLNPIAINLALDGAILAAASVIVWWNARLPRGDQRASWLVIVLIAFDLLSQNTQRAFSPSGSTVVDPVAIDGHRTAIDYVRADPDFQGGRYLRVETSAVGSSWEDGVIVVGLPSIGGYTSALLARFNTYIDSVQRQVHGARDFSGLVKSYQSPLFDLLNVKYILSSAEEVPGLGPGVRQADFVKVYDGWPRVYQNRRFLPRVFLVDHGVIADTEDEAVRLLESPTFDPSRVVILSPPVDERFIASLGGGMPMGPDSYAAIVEYGNAALDVDVRTPRAALLFLSEVDYPGWNAFVDGHPAPIWRADYLFRAVPVAPGQHRISLVFLPRDARVGFWAFDLALLVALILGVQHCLRSSSGWVRGSTAGLSWFLAVAFCLAINTGMIMGGLTLLSSFYHANSSRILEDFSAALDAAQVTQPNGLVPRVMAADYEIGGLLQRGILDHPDGTITWSVASLPEHTSLVFSTAIAPECAGIGDGVEFRVIADSEAESRVLFDFYDRNDKTAAAEHWRLHRVDLSAYARKRVSFTLGTRPGPNGDYTCDWAIWGAPRLVSRQSAHADLPAWQLLPGPIARLVTGKSYPGAMAP